jgi:hypothetical protein
MTKIDVNQAGKITHKTDTPLWRARMTKAAKQIRKAITKIAKLDWALSEHVAGGGNGVVFSLSCDVVC